MQLLQSSHRPSQEDRCLHRQLRLLHLKYEKKNVSLHVCRGKIFRMAIFKVKPRSRTVRSDAPTIKHTFKYHNSTFDPSKTYHHRHHRLSHLHLGNWRLLVIREIRKGNKFRFGF